MALYYADTSALVKLVVEEAETAALRQWIGTERPQLVACDLARAELLRAVRRAAPDRAVAARSVLDSIILTVLDSVLVDRAGHLDPAILRTLDAIHVAAALELGDELAGMLTYDERRAEAAAGHGIAVVAPRRVALARTLPEGACGRSRGSPCDRVKSPSTPTLPSTRQWVEVRPSRGARTPKTPSAPRSSPS